MIMCRCCWGGLHISPCGSGSGAALCGGRQMPSRGSRCRHKRSNKVHPLGPSCPFMPQRQQMQTQAQQQGTPSWPFMPLHAPAINSMYLLVVNSMPCNWARDTALCQASGHEEAVTLACSHLVLAASSAEKEAACAFRLCSVLLARRAT